MNTNETDSCLLECNSRKKMREAGLTWDTLDWAALDRLRDTFLGAKPAGANYWMSWSDLENYDFTFAQRIAWK